MPEAIKKVVPAVASNAGALKEKVSNLETKYEGDKQNTSTAENELMTYEDNKTSADNTFQSKSEALNSANANLGTAQSELEKAMAIPVEIKENKDGTKTEDTSKRDAAIKKAQDALNKAKTELEKAQKDKDAAQKDIDKISKEIENTQNKINELKDKENATQGELNSAKQELSNAEKAEQEEKNKKKETNLADSLKPDFFKKYSQEGLNTDFANLNNPVGVLFESPYQINKNASDEDITKLSESAKILINPEDYTEEEKAKAKKDITSIKGFYNTKDEKNSTYIELANDAKEYIKTGDKEKAQEIKDDIVDAFTVVNKKNGVSQETIDAINLAYQEIGVSESGGDNLGEMLKYGGRPGDPWCASFASWVYEAGQNKDNKDTFGYEVAVRQLRKDAIDAGYYSKVGTYEPVSGDIMIQENNASHTGIVVKTDENYIYTIEGNAGDKVRAKKYAKDGYKVNTISGYIRMNEWKGSTVNPISIDYLTYKDFEDADKYINQSTI